MSYQEVTFDYQGTVVKICGQKNDYIFKAIQRTNSFYELNLLEILSKILKPKSIVYDVGAHIGNHSLFFARVVGAEVFSFEPSEESFQLLKHNIDKNSLETSVSAYNYALGKCESKGIVISQDEDNSGKNAVSLDRSGNVSVIDLDSVALTGKVDFIKIDVEGMELEVLQGAARTLETNKPGLAVEVTKQNFNALFNLLFEAGYTIVGCSALTPTWIWVHKTAGVCGMSADEISTLLMVSTVYETGKEVNIIMKRQNSYYKLLEWLSSKLKDKESLDSLLYGAQTLNRFCDQLCAQKISLEADNLSLKSQLLELEESVERLTNENVVLEESLSILQKSKDKEESHAFELQTQLDSLKKKNADLQVECKDLQATNADLQVECKDLQATNADLQVECKDLQATNADLQVESACIKKQLEECISSVVRLENIYDTLRSEKLELEKLYNKIMSDYKTLSSTCSEQRMEAKKINEFNELLSCRLVGQRSAYETALAQHIDLISSMVESKSWKITFPLRYLFDFLRGNPYSGIDLEDFTKKTNMKMKEEFDELELKCSSSHEFFSPNAFDRYLDGKGTKSCFRRKKGSLIKSYERAYSSMSKLQSTCAAIATMPERASFLEEVVNTLLNQVDILCVYLNNWNYIPEFLKKDKIRIARSQDHGDVGDAGKFFWVDEHDGYYFTCDDDILYPAEYISKLVLSLEKYNHQAVVGWHGSLIRSPFEDYYCPQSRKVFAFYSKRPFDTPVHMLGTGCMGFHTSTIDVRFADFPTPNMADVYFALLGQRQQVPFIVIKHDKNELTPIEAFKDFSINKHCIHNQPGKLNTKERQNQVVAMEQPWVSPLLPLRIALVGRFENYTKGGIHKSCKLMEKVLLDRGNYVRAFDLEKDTKPSCNGYDVAYIYPGDPLRPDFEFVPGVINSFRSCNVPVVVNFSYIPCDERPNWIAQQILHYNSEKHLPPVYASVFSHEAMNDPALSSIKDYLVFMPKTVDVIPCDVIKSFTEREGICLGDSAKFFNPNITRADHETFIDALQSALPHVNLYTFKQYSSKISHPKINFVPYMKHGFLEWLSGIKLMICFSTCLTFEMVPCEAQSVGTPILFSNMPQSLNEYIGRTGLQFNSPSNLAELAFYLYNDIDAWNDFSVSGYFNSMASSVNLQASNVEYAFRQVVSTFK